VVLVSANSVRFKKALKGFLSKPLFSFFLFTIISVTFFPTKMLYFGTGTLFSAASALTRVSWAASFLSPRSLTLRNECLALSDLSGIVARHLLSFAFHSDLNPHAHTSWKHNRALLFEVPISSAQDQQLIDFLQERYLAKFTGFFPSMVKWVYPCFGTHIQIHPNTKSSYTRNPWNNLSMTYINRVEKWKEQLPHPPTFPLILTRPFDLRTYLPPSVSVSYGEEISNIVEKTVEKLKKCDVKVLVDLTDFLPKDPNQWSLAWNRFRLPFYQECLTRKIPLQRIICIERLQQDEVGGIRMLPLSDLPEKEEELYRDLLLWVSTFGLTANRVELDRKSLLASRPLVKQGKVISFPKEAFVDFLAAFEQRWQCDHPQKTMMVKGTLAAMKGFFDTLTEEHWVEISHSRTKQGIVNLCFSKMTRQLKKIEEQSKSCSFFELASLLELVHADFMPLLEIFSPFTIADFSTIYQECLTNIPARLKPLTSYTLHSFAMSSVAGIMKAVETNLGRAPHILFGENTYFECIAACAPSTKATLITQAAQEEWEEADLILAQFNPALKRINFQVTDYKAEEIADVVRCSLKARKGKPVTLALDCTFDYIDSSRNGRLLDEFQEEIKSGALHVIGYRSGLKFDLFGMDNYCGAPLFIISNSPQFNFLLTDPALQSDRLSVNWFCLAYKYCTPYLEQYRKQIFDNTRALLNRIPKQMYEPHAHYRVVPIDADADSAFIDIKVSGLFHHQKMGAFVGGALFVKSLEGGHPMFCRPSVGFYHPNFTMLFSEENSTTRLTLGIDPDQVDVLLQAFKMLDSLNGF
jgi:hypothetical protein